MSERFKNILAYAGIVFNVIVGATSIYTLATDITSAPWGITFIIVAIIKNLPFVFLLIRIISYFILICNIQKY